MLEPTSEVLLTRHGAMLGLSLSLPCVGTGVVAPELPLGSASHLCTPYQQIIAKHLMPMMRQMRKAMEAQIHMLVVGVRRFISVPRLLSDLFPLYDYGTLRFTLCEP